MRTNEILREIQQLPISQRIYVVEKTMRSLRKQEEESTMKEAANLLLSDYNSDEELTIFSQLDFDDFYEAK